MYAACCLSLQLTATLLKAAYESRALSSGSVIDKVRLERNYELGKNRVLVLASEGLGLVSDSYLDINFNKNTRL